MIALPTNAELVDACAATYLPPSVPFFQPPGFTDRIFRSETAAGVAVFALEGTYNLPGWLGDFLALGTQDQEAVKHPSLGFVHLDFYIAALRFLDLIAAEAKKGPFAITGHSRGAALAAMLSGLLIDDGLAPVKVALYAPPRAGGAAFVKIVSSVPCPAWRYGNDPVVDVPLTLTDFPYVQFPLNAIGSPCPVPSACHHIANYVSAVHSLTSQDQES